MKLDLLANHIRIYEDRSSNYDEVFEIASMRIRQRGSAEKQDLASLAFWKRLNCSSRWVTSLLHMSNREVREVTAAAFREREAHARFGVLARQLPGCGNWGPFASTVLCAYDPVNYAVRDRRAIKGLERIGCRIQTGSGEWRRYHDQVLEVRDALRQDSNWEDATARQVDKGLFELGGRERSAPVSAT